MKANIYIFCKANTKFDAFCILPIEYFEDQKLNSPKYKTETTASLTYAQTGVPVPLATSLTGYLCLPWSAVVLATADARSCSNQEAILHAARGIAWKEKFFFSD